MGFNLHQDDEDFTFTHDQRAVGVERSVAPSFRRTSWRERRPDDCS